MKQTLTDVIDALGVGWCQVRLVFLAGGIYTVGGEILFLFSTFPGAISHELGLAANQKAALASAVFLGMLIGNLVCCGIDSLGRRIPLLAAFFGILVFAGASAMTRSFSTIVVLWILTGVSYGIGVPSFNALISETSPTKWRFLLNGLAMAIFPLGSLHAAFLVYQHAPDLASVGPHWRTILLFERVPNLIFLVLCILPGFVESPHYLAVFRSHQEAEKELEIIASQNGAPSTCLDFRVEKTAAGSGSDSTLQRILMMFGPKLWATTVVVGFTTFMLNFIQFGSMYTLPAVLSKVHLGMSPAMSLAVATLFEFAGYLVGFALERFTRHKTLMVIYLMGCLLFTALFIYGVLVLQTNTKSLEGILLVQFGVNGTRLVMSIGWIVSYVYAGSAFPTAVRACASGLCIGCGRVGSMCAPWVFEKLLAATGSFLCYFWITGAACFLNIVMVLLVLKETKGIQLDEGVEAMPICSSFQ